MSTDSRLLFLLVGLVLSAPASAQHVHTGPVPPTVPSCWQSATRVWWHVVVDAEDARPVRFATDRSTLEVHKGGDTLYPGSSIDVLALEVCVVAPQNAGQPRVSVEKRLAASPITVDPLGQLRSVGARKIDVRVLTPNQWTNLASNVSGLVKWELTAVGGALYYGTHLDLTKPAVTPRETVGLSKRLEAGKTVKGIGNPAGLFVWTYEPGVTAIFDKTGRGYSW